MHFDAVLGGTCMQTCMLACWLVIGHVYVHFEWVGVWGSNGACIQSCTHAYYAATFEITVN